MLITNHYKKLKMKQAISLFVLLISIIGYSQSNTQKDWKVEDEFMKIDFLVPGFSYEMGVTSKSTITFQGSVGFVYRKINDNPGEYGFFPYVITRYRNYLNFERRLGLKKNVANNSANFISGSLVFLPGYLLVGNIGNADSNIAIGPSYGFQRTYQSGFNLNLEFGVRGAYNFVSSEANAVPFIDLSLGWAINSRKK